MFGCRCEPPTGRQRATWGGAHGGDAEGAGDARQAAKQKTDITEQELQAIAKAMYEERLAEVCTLQRSTPYDVEDHSALEAVMDLEDWLIHPILDECLPQAVFV